MRLRTAFALLPVLILSALCLALALLVRWQGSLASMYASSASQSARARLTALAAARVGVGELSQVLGPDTRLSGTDALGRVWWARRVEETWERGGVGGQFRDAGSAGLVWSVRDLSCACDLSAPVLAAARATPISRLPRMRQRLASGATLAPSPSMVAAARVGDVEALRALQALEVPLAACTVGTRSLLVNPLDGQWRENLSVPSALAAVLDGDLARALLLPSPSLREQPSRGMLPLDVGLGEARLRHMPLVVDLELSLGVFNARSDGRHRVRVHAGMVLWNPSALPLLTSSDKRMFLVEVEGAPEITVTNLDSGASFSTWLDRCPPGNFWSYTQGVRERSLWWWLEILDTTRHGMVRSGILPGEVYAALMPDPSAQPYGLARVIGSETWRYDDKEHPPGWVRPSPETFLPTDRIVLSMRFVTPGTTVRLHPHIGPLDAATEAADYASPALLALRHIPWPDARLEITGADYSRVDSNGYVLGERRFCWRARLAATTAQDVYALASNPYAMGPDIDFADPTQRQAWILTSDAVAEAQRLPSDASSVPSFAFRDAVVNRHEAATDGAFSDWRLRDLPVDPPIDVASLRFLYGVKPERWLGQIDRAFFACPDSTQPELSENPRLQPWSLPLHEAALVVLREHLSSPRAAEVLALEGAFNVHTRDPQAWEAFLCAVPLQWTAETGETAHPGKLDVPAAFFTQPTGAMLAKFASSTPCDLADVSIEQLGDIGRQRLLGRQSVRSPAQSKLRLFCAALTDEMGRQDVPFAGLSDFFRSGVVDRAIQSSGLNDGLPEGSPVYLTAANLFGAHTSLMVARGDTFAVTGEAQVGGCTQKLELTVQRVPHLAARPHLGRRFIVTKARWLDSAYR